MTMRTLTALALAVCSGPALAAESYAVTATTSLSLDGDTLVQRWTASCVGIEAAATALIVPGGKDLRFFAAPDEVAAVGVDEQTYGIEGEAGASYDYDGVTGAHVFARLTVRCGTLEVFDEVVVESLPIVVPPGLDAPSSVQRDDTLLPVPGGVIPVGVEVELVGLGVRASPRGDELLAFSITGPGVNVSGELSSDEVGADGRAALSPRFTATGVGELVVDASLLGVAATPLVFTVVPADDIIDPDPDDPPPGGVQSIGCQSAGPPGVMASAALVVAVLLRRRRRAPSMR